MLTPQGTLEHLLQPISPETFFQQYWEQRPLLVSRHNPDYYAGLFSVKNIDTLLKFSKPKYPRVKLGKSQKRGFSLNVLEGMETQSIQDYGVPNLHRLYDAYMEGDTLLIYKVDDYWEPLARMCRNLEQCFSYPAGAVLFFTPKNAQGFSPHFDADDGFVLQIDGAKVWRIYNASPYLSLADDYQPGITQPLPMPEQELCLQAGDLLYLPRGCVHEVLTTDTSSLHITIGVNVFTWADLLTSAVATGSKDTCALHKALPIGFLNQTQPERSLQGHLTALLDTLRQHANAQEAVTQLAQRFIKSRQALPDGHFSQLEHLHQVTLQSVVTKRHGMICWVATQDHQVSIQFPENEVKGPGWIEPALRFIVATDTFTVRSLPDVLNDHSKLVLVRRLIREGLLKVIRVSQDEVPAAQGETCSTAMGWDTAPAVR